jgi:hypothetical protein
MHKSNLVLLCCLVVCSASFAFPQSTNDPFPAPIPATQGAITVKFVEFAAVPDGRDGPARMMLLVAEPGTKRMFVNDMRGQLYSVSYDGKKVALYVDINAADWGVAVQSQGNERGFQSFAFHPQFNQPGTPGFGKFYTYTDTTNTTPAADFVAVGAANRTHDTVLLEWTAGNPQAETYDGEKPRELLRMAQPFSNHNGGHLTFNPLANSGSPDFGLLYVGVADGGSGGDPLNLAQNRSSAFGKILRINPLGTNSRNGKYGIPAANPFVDDPSTLGEIYAYGLRNPQRFAWDSKSSNMFVADIGQNIVEKVSLVKAGANLGWNVWEGSFRFGGREVSTADPRSDPKVTYPVVEYGQPDPLFQSNSAVTLGYVYRQTAVPQLAHLLLFGDNPSGEIFYIDADKLPNGGQEPIRRILLDDGSGPKTLLQLIKEKNATQSRPPATRADLRFGQGPDGQILILNKRDGIIRMLVR